LALDFAEFIVDFLDNRKMVVILFFVFFLGELSVLQEADDLLFFLIFLDAMLDFGHKLAFLFIFLQFADLPLFLQGIHFFLELKFSERGASNFVEVEFFDFIVVKVLFGEFFMKEVGFVDVDSLSFNRFSEIGVFLMLIGLFDGFEEVFEFEDFGLAGGNVGAELFKNGLNYF
jgi:hypothetical protein